MLIYGFVFRHKLSQAALGDFLTVVKILMQMSSKLPSSKYLLEKSLNIRDPKEVKRNYYCPNCQRDVLLHTIQCPNPQCSNKIDKKLLKKKGHFYVHLDMEEAIRNTIEMPTVSKNLLERFKERSSTLNDHMETLSDIMDGKAYRQLGMYGMDS